MLLGAIADDFTGAGDVANTLAHGLPGAAGLRTMQYLGIPTQPAAREIQAGVISLKTRSIPAAEAVSLSLRALAWLKAQGCRQILFKYCSTFDSTPRGNIGPVAEALARALAVRGVVVCPAVPAIGRTVYQGHLFVHDQLLCESSLRHHPLNPMTDSDIRRWLRLQCSRPVGWVPWSIVSSGPAAVLSALNEAAERGEALVAVDAVRQEDLLTIGRACRGSPLVTGGSGVALGLMENFVGEGLASSAGSCTAAAIPGPEAILSGSCSEATRRQIETHSRSHPTFRVDVERAVTGIVEPAELVQFIRAHRGEAPLVYACDVPERVAEVQRKHGPARVAGALDALFAATARLLVTEGIRRLVVAGGETSGAVMMALGIQALAIGPQIDPGVPVLISEDPQPLALALKSGNLGSPDFFARALRKLAGEA